jgi:hypothetical protein
MALTSATSVVALIVRSRSPVPAAGRSTQGVVSRSHRLNHVIAFVVLDDMGARDSVKSLLHAFGPGWLLIAVTVVCAIGFVFEAAAQPSGTTVKSIEIRGNKRIELPGLPGD